MKKVVVVFLVLTSGVFAQGIKEENNTNIKLTKLRICENSWMKTQIVRCVTITGFVPKDNIVVIPREPVNLFDEETASINGSAAKKIASTKPKAKVRNPGFVAYWVPSLKPFEESEQTVTQENNGGMTEIIIPRNEDEIEKIRTIYNRDEGMAIILETNLNRNLWNLFFGAPLTHAWKGTKNVIGIVYKLGFRKTTSGKQEVAIAFITPLKSLEEFLNDGELVKTFQKKRTSVLKAERIPGTWIDFFPPNITAEEKLKIQQAFFKP